MLGFYTPETSCRWTYEMPIRASPLTARLLVSVSNVPTSHCLQRPGKAGA